jgi:transposase InsO family protein
VRHGTSRLPRDEESASKRGRSAETTIGYVHADPCELRLAQGRLDMFLAIDRVPKFAHVASSDAANKMNGAALLREVVATFPCAIPTVLTDNGMAFADRPKYRDGATARRMGHIVDRVCRESGIEGKLSWPYHPWTHGQAERRDRTVKKAPSRSDGAVTAFHHPDLDSLEADALASVAACNSAKHPKRLRWRTPFRAVCDAWTRDPTPFRIDPRHLIAGPHN